MKTKRPLLLVIHKQRVHIEGEGSFQMKVTSLVNPYTLKQTSLIPSIALPSTSPCDPGGRTNSNTKSGYLDRYQQIQALQQTERRLGKKIKAIGNPHMQLISAFQQSYKGMNEVYSKNKIEQQETTKKNRRQTAATRILFNILSRKQATQFRDFKEGTFQVMIDRQQMELKRDLVMFKLVTKIDTIMKRKSTEVFNSIKHIGGVNKSNGSSYSRLRQQQSTSLGSQTQDGFNSQQMRGVKTMTYLLSNKVRQHQLELFIYLRRKSIHRRRASKQFMEQLDFDFGKQSFNKVGLENELASRFNKVSFKRLDSKNENGLSLPGEEEGSYFQNISVIQGPGQASNFSMEMSGLGMSNKKRTQGLQLEEVLLESDMEESLVSPSMKFEDVENNINYLNKDIGAFQVEIEKLERLIKGEDILDSPEGSPRKDGEEQKTSSQSAEEDHYNREAIIRYYEMKAAEGGDEVRSRGGSWDIQELKNMKVDGLNDSRQEDFDGLEEYFQSQGK